MTREQILQKMYIDKDINEAIGKMQPFDLQDDLRQELYLVLCEQSEEKLMEMYTKGWIKYFLVRTICNMAKSDRSTFFKTFRKTFIEYGEHHDRADEVFDEEMMMKVNKSMGELHWYEREVFVAYAEVGNITEISRETKIPVSSLYKTIRKVRKTIRHGINNKRMDQKLIGNYIVASMDFTIDTSCMMDAEAIADLMDEISTMIKEKINTKIREDVFIKKICDLRIKQIV